LNGSLSQLISPLPYLPFLCESWSEFMDELLDRAGTAWWGRGWSYVSHGHWSDASHGFLDKSAKGSGEIVLWRSLLQIDLSSTLEHSRGRVETCFGSGLTAKGNGIAQLDRRHDLSTKLAWNSTSRRMREKLARGEHFQSIIPHIHTHQLVNRHGPPLGWSCSHNFLCTAQYRWSCCLTGQIWLRDPPILAVYCISRLFAHCLTAIFRPRWRTYSLIPAGGSTRGICRGGELLVEESPPPSVPPTSDKNHWDASEAKQVGLFYQV